MDKPASVGKTVAIAGSMPLALVDLLYQVFHDAYSYSWFTLTMSTDIVILAVGLAAFIMHKNQRAKEDEKSDEQNGAGVTGGPERSQLSEPNTGSTSGS